MHWLLDLTARGFCFAPFLLTRELATSTRDGGLDTAADADAAAAATAAIAIGIINSSVALDASPSFSVARTIVFVDRAPDLRSREGDAIDGRECLEECWSKVCKLHLSTGARVLGG